ncbi:MAG: hypothetical protein OXG08_01665 [Gammaproteobacteria bacterium]|nr:hypothetical protein [Gammaproteobacteria bacterium]
MESRRIYCSDLSTAAGENMLGTAPQVDFWILLEYREQWTRKAVDDNELPDPVSSWLGDSIAALEKKGRKPRVQFIRQPRRATGPRKLFVSESSLLRSMSFSSYLDLTEIDLEQDVTEAQTSNFYCVCAHASRDLCCSRYGLATWNRLLELSEGRAWQSTHLGGHRFAPNVLVLPQGRLYGRVHLNKVDGFFSKVENGEVDYELLRGRSEFASEAQACECLVEHQVNSVLACDSDLVRFATTKGELEVNVPARREEMAVVASCGDDEPTYVRPFTDT